MSNEISEDLSSSPSKVTIISDEARERMEKNRLEAKRRLMQRAAQFSSQTDSQTVSYDPPKAKRIKTAKELEYISDLKNVVSDGSVVRVQGTKLIDTGGGFLIEEKDLIEQEEESKPLVVQPAALLPNESPICEECNCEFSDSFLLHNYDHNVCDVCKDTDEKHSFITRTDAKNEYLLKDVDLDKREPILKFMTRPNPHNSRWGDMKLYLRLQVEKRAIEVWESLEKIEEHREQREENKVKTKIKKYNKKMESLRMSARSSLYTRDLKAHEHVWRAESYDSDEDNYSHTCVECGQEESYEKM